KKAGKGEQEIKTIKEGERVDIEIRFKKPFEGMANVHFITESISQNQTRVKWGMKGKSNYPLNFMNLFMDKILGNDLEKSLGNLKDILEK
ncbi:MAG: SRPBCC family protein, partial [Chitinophagaceae bacterium]